jgi:DNA polymerase-3 subunit epsilon
MNYVAIDFETAISHHICAVGIVSVENGVIVDTYSSYVQPPDNQYNPRTIEVHGIQPHQTVNSPAFSGIYPEIKKRLEGKVVVAHNESFDRSVLTKSMKDVGLEYAELQLPDRWECTFRIYKSKGFQPAGLDACCERLAIDLNHHEALSDAIACAELYKLYLKEQK